MRIYILIGVLILAALFIFNIDVGPVFKAEASTSVELVMDSDTTYFMVDPIHPEKRVEFQWFGDRFYVGSAAFVTICVLVVAVLIIVLLI